MNLEGGCLCGAVRYQFSGTPVRQSVCHCRDCQRSGGSVFHAGMWVPRTGFSIKGEVRKYESKADSGRSISRSFCPICGSGITIEAELRPEHIAIKVGTLDDPSIVQPVAQIYARSKMPWLSIQGVDTFEQMPPV
jgi:hypothetical protein